MPGAVTPRGRTDGARPGGAVCGTGAARITCARRPSACGPAHCHAASGAGPTRALSPCFELAPMRLRIITPVPLNRLGAAAGPTALTADLGDFVQQRQQLRDVIAVGLGEDR